MRRSFTSLPLVLGLLCASPAFAAGKAQPRHAKHMISTSQAQAMVARLAGTRGGETTYEGTPISYTWPVEAMRALLAQPGVVDVRIQHALEPDGTPTLVVFGMKSDGTFAPMSMNNVMPCPPFCWEIPF